MHSKNKAPEPPTIQPRRALTLDVEKYQQMLDAPEISEEQRQDFLKAIWNIVVSFVDLGFEIRPDEHCGKAGQSEDEATIQAIDLLELSQLNLNEEFQQSACESMLGKE